MKRLILFLPLCLLFVFNSNAQNVGVGNSSPNSKLDISGDLALREGTAITVSSGANTITLPSAKNSVYRLTGATGAFSISSISAGNDGMLLTLINVTGQIMTVTNGSIQTNTGANLVATGTVSSVNLLYNGTLGKWVVTGDEGFGATANNAWNLTGNSGTTSSNFIGTTDANPIYFKTNNNLIGYLPNTGTGNLMFGYGLGSPTGTNNVMLGSNCGGTTSSGGGNVAIGSSSLRYNTTGGNNVAIGNAANASNNTGSFNIVMGYQSLLYNTTGSNNISIGQQTLYNSTGSNNVVVGGFAGVATNGGGNVFLGYGAGQFETGSNKLYISNSNTSTPLIYGDFSSGSLTINNNLTTTNFQMTNGATAGYLLQSDASGNGTWVAPSSITANNIYNTDGTLTGSRTVTMGGNNLTFTGTSGSFTYSASSNANASFGTGNSVTGGSGSFAAGSNNTASGSNSIALGANHNVSGAGGFAAGATNTVTATNAAAIGQQNSAGGYGSLAVGVLASTSGSNSFAMGHNSNASANSSAAIGEDINALSFGEVVVGINATGYTPSSTTAYAGTDRVFNVGNGSSYGSKSDALTVLKNGNVGIGNNSPSSTLTVNGKTATTNLQVTNGAALGYILQSDASGNGTWVNPSTSLLATASNNGITWNSGLLKFQLGGSLVQATTINQAGYALSIGTDAANNALTLGSTNGSSTTTIQAGTGAINLSAATTNIGVGGTTTGTAAFKNSTNTNSVSLTSGVTSASYTLTLPTAVGASGQVLTATNNTGTLGWATPTTGTVTSVGLSLPSIITVTGSPVTTSGTLTGTLASQSANTVFAAPNGSAGTPSFRTLVAADIPALTLNGDVTGTTAASTLSKIQGVALSISSLASGNILQYNGTNWVNVAPSSLTVNNIYTADGTLAGNRTVTMGADNLTFSSSTGNFIFSPSSTGNVVIGSGDNTANPSGAILRGPNAGSGNTTGGGILTLNGGFGYNGTSGGSVYINGGTTSGSGTNGNVYIAGGYTSPNQGAVYVNHLYTGQTFINDGGGIVTIGNSSVGTAEVNIQNGLVIDRASANNGAISNLNSSTTGNGITFGLSSGEGIASNRANSTAGQNQYGIDLYTNFIRRLSVTNGGSVGIGTTNPSATLHVVGTGIVTSTFYVNNNGTSTASGSTGTIQLGDGLISKTYGSGFTMNSSLSINTTTVPSNTLTVNGSGGMWNSSQFNFYTDAGVTQKGFIGNYSSGSDFAIAATTSGNWMRIGANNANIAFFPDNTITTAANPKVVINSSGYVGIGTSGPNYPLEVVSTVTTSFSGYGYLSSSGAGSGSGNSGSVPVSIHSVGRILSAEVDVQSDERIKENINHPATTEMLDKVNSLQVADYNYIDKLAKGTNTKRGFIAQQVETVLPNAVNKNTDVVPGVFAAAEKVSCTDSILTITTIAPHGFAAGDEILLYDKDNHPKTVHVATVNGDKTFTISGWEDKATTAIFVYGKKVNDFRTVDFDQITALAVGAIQELDKKIKTLESKNQKLESENSSIKSDVDKLKASVETLQQIIGAKAQK